MIKKIYFQRLLACVYFAFVWFRYMLGGAEWLVLLPVFGLALFFASWKMLLKYRAISLAVYSFFFLFFLVSLFSSFRTGFYSVYFVFLGLTAFLVAQSLFHDQKFSFGLSFVLFYLFFFYCVSVIYFDSRASYSSLNEMFPEASRNVVGAMAIFLFSFYALSSYRYRKALPLLAFFCTAYLVVSTYGRSSILTFIILFIPYLCFYFKRRFLFTLTFLCFSVVGAILFGLSYQEYFLRFEQSGLDSPRIQMYVEYFESLDFFKFILGASVLDSPLISSFDGNSHSSYIRSHSYYGIVSFAFFVFVFFMVFVRLKVNIVGFWFLVAYMFRVVFEQIAFFDVFDFLFFYCILFLWYGFERNDVAIVVGCNRV